MRRGEREYFPPNPSENKFLDLNFQREIIKKKHMLDLMMQKKMSRRKKKIIKVYGKDMLAEMYLDLLNITEGESIPKRILSPLSGRIPKNIRRGGSKRTRWNNDSTIPIKDSRNFKLNNTSMFNSPNNIKSSSRSRGKRTNGSRSKEIRGDVASAEAPKTIKFSSQIKNNKEVKRIRTTKAQTTGKLRYSRK